MRWVRGTTRWWKNPSMKTTPSASPSEIGRTKMPQREFDITINANGDVEVHIQGFKGKTGCKSAAALFEKIVGETKTLQETSEYYEPEEVVRHQIDQKH